ncbi:hypothetical protein D3C85_1255680 [compost metagenome]
MLDDRGLLPLLLLGGLHLQAGQAKEFLLLMECWALFILAVEHQRRESKTIVGQRRPNLVAYMFFRRVEVLHSGDQRYATALELIGNTHKPLGGQRHFREDQVTSAVRPRDQFIDQAIDTLITVKTVRVG